MALLVPPDQGRIAEAVVVDAVLGQQRSDLVDQQPALFDHRRAGRVVVGGGDPLGGPGVDRRGLPLFQQVPAAVEPELGHCGALGGRRLGDAIVVLAGDQDDPGVDVGLVVPRELLQPQADAVRAAPEADLVEHRPLQPGRDPAGLLQHLRDLGLVLGDGLRPPAQVERPPAVEASPYDHQDEDQRSPELPESHSPASSSLTLAYARDGLPIHPLAVPPGADDDRSWPQPWTSTGRRAPPARGRRTSSTF